MHFLILVFFLAIGGNEAVFWQRLTCPYEAQQQNLLWVWCRQSSPECCKGLTFSNSSQLADEGKLRVTQDLHSFTVELLEPSYTGGVYWCGLLSRNDTIIKLAEGYFYSSSAAFIWSFTRWMLLPLLPVATICAHVCTTMKANQCCKKQDEPYDDVAAGEALADPLYESPDSQNERKSSGI